MKRLWFLKDEPSLFTKAFFFTLGNSVWIVPGVVGVGFNDLRIVIGAYALLGAAMIPERVRECVLLLNKWVRIPQERFKLSAVVSRQVRETLRNSGLIRVEKKEIVKGDKKEKREIEIFPRVDIRLDDYNYYLEFRMLPGQTVGNWESKADAFSSALGCDLVSFKVSKGVVKAVLQHTTLLAKEVPYKRDDEHYLTIGYGAMGPIKWEFDSEPHLLIIGPTRQGKSTFMRNLFIQFPRDWNVKIVDGKIVEFVFMRKHGFDVAAGYDYKASVDAAWNEMNRRYEEMDKQGVNNYRKTGYKPYFLVIDEYLAIVENLEKKERERLFGVLTEIAVKGGACGVFLVLILQRPDASFLPTVVRDNTLAKVVLGQASNTCYEMAFGAENRKLEPLKKGQGYCQLGSELMTFGFSNYEQEKFMEDLRFVTRILDDQSTTNGKERAAGDVESAG